MAKDTNQVIDLIRAGRISQDRKISNEMLQNYSESRLKIELDKYKKESLSILSNQLITRVTEVETPSVIAHTVEYSGYFINEAEFAQIKEILGWKPQQPETTEPKTDQPQS